MQVSYYNVSIADIYRGMSGNLVCSPKGLQTQRLFIYRMSLTFRRSEYDSMKCDFLHIADWGESLAHYHCQWKYLRKCFLCCCIFFCSPFWGLELYLGLKLARVIWFLKRRVIHDRREVNSCLVVTLALLLLCNLKSELLILIMSEAVMMAKWVELQKKY